MWQTLPSLPAPYILAGILSCAPQPAPHIDITFQNSPPAINHILSTQKLASLRETSISPHYGAEFPIVGGITSSDFNISYTLDFKQAMRPLLSTACIWAETLHINIMYKPTIYIASNYRANSCRYAITEEHEMKHVNIDIITFKEFIPHLKKTAEQTVASWQGIGPIDKEKVEESQNAIAQPLSDMLTKVTDVLQSTRTKRQQQVDSRDEYRYLSNACRNEPAL